MVSYNNNNSLRRQDILALCNLRQDGRKKDEIRRLYCNLRPLHTGTNSCHGGSCLFEMGLTRVLVSVSGPTECARRSDESVDKANLTVSVSQSPFATSSTRQQTSATSKRMLEMSNDIKTAFQAAVLLQLYPRAAIFVNVHILADDGGVLECAINAVTLALVGSGIALKDLVCACSAGTLNEMVLLDLNRVEEMDGSGSACKMSVATMPQRSSVVLTKLSSRLTIKELELVLKSAQVGCRSVYDVMAQVIRDHHATLVAARMGNVHVKVNI